MVELRHLDWYLVPWRGFNFFSESHHFTSVHSQMMTNYDGKTSVAYPKPSSWLDLTFKVIVTWTTESLQRQNIFWTATKSRFHLRVGGWWAHCWIKSHRRLSEVLLPEVNSPDGRPCRGLDGRACSQKTDAGQAPKGTTLIPHQDTTELL